MKTRTSIITVAATDYPRLLADLSAQGRPPVAVERRKGKRGVTYTLTLPALVVPVCPRSQTYRGAVVMTTK